REFLQGLVAGGVTELVIDELEAVEIEETQVAPRVRLPDLLQNVGMKRIEAAAVVEAGQLIHDGELPDRALKPVSFDREHDGAIQHDVVEISLQQEVLRAHLHGADAEVV